MSRLRAFLRDVAAACQPRELAEAHREIDRMNKRYADMVVRLARAQVTIKHVREYAQHIHRSGNGSYSKAGRTILEMLDEAEQAATTRNETE